jgi:hypothetical protein
MPTMAKAPTLAIWELEKLRTIENVIRRGHLDAVDRGKLMFASGSVPVADDALVVHCAADGLKYPPLVPIWGPDAITLQPIRAGFPCFGAALAGYVEATRDDDAEKNRVCQPSPYADTPSDWATMQVIGGDASLALTRETDLREWSNTTPLNPSRIPADRADDPAVLAAKSRLKEWIIPGRARLAAYAGGA